MDITSLRAAQNDTSISPVGRSGSGLGVIGSKDGTSAVDSRASISASISSGNRHGHGHHAANSSRFVEQDVMNIIY